MTPDDPRIAELSAHTDRLLRAIGELPHLEQFIDQLDAYEALLAFTPADHPLLADALATSAVWKALAEVSREMGRLLGREGY